MENFPHLPTLLSVASAVIVLTLVLNYVLFKPLNGILDERKRRTREAHDELAAAQVAQARRFEEIEVRLKETRREAFEVRDAARRAGRQERDELLAAAREEAQKMVEGAREEIAADLAKGKRDLDAEADRLSQMIAERILGRPVGSATGDNE